MKTWSDPSQKPLVRPVLFEEVGGPPRAPSPFFEGRSRASYMEGGAAEAPLVEGGGADGDGHDAFSGDPGLEGAGGFAEYGSFDDGASSFDPIVPAEALAAAPSAQSEPADDPRVHAALDALRGAAEGLLDARRDALASAEHDVIRLAVALAKRIVAAELALRPDLVLAAAREGLAVLSESDRFVVRLAPGPSEERLAAFRAELAAKHPRSEVVVDDRLTPFSCVVENEHGRVDESIGARMGAVLEQAGLTKVAGTP